MLLLILLASLQTGQAPVGTASWIAQGAAIRAQVIPNWSLMCETPGSEAVRTRIDVTLAPDGSLVGEPVVVDPPSEPVERALAHNALRAVQLTAPFDTPEGFIGGDYRLVFDHGRACARRDDPKL